MRASAARVGDGCHNGELSLLTPSTNATVCPHVAYLMKPPSRQHTGCGPRLRHGGGGPQVDAAFDRIAVDLGQLLGAELQMLQCSDVLLELRDAARTDQH